MKLKKFAIQDILNLDVNSREIQDWIELCDLQGIDEKTFVVDPNAPSLLEKFINNYPPKNDFLNNHLLMVITTFGLLYFNKEEVLECHMKVLKEALLNEKSFYNEISYNHFKDEVIDDRNIEQVIDHFFVRLEGAKQDVSLKIKKDYEAIKLKKFLDSTLDSNLIKQKKIKV